MKVMKLSPELIFDKFKRTYPEPFTAKEFQKLCICMGEKITEQEATVILRSSDEIFVLENGYFLTRSGAFTGCYFSFIPTREELAAKVFTLGDRGMPFIDGTKIPAFFSFTYKDKPLERKIFTTTASLALDLHPLFGDEYSPQIIASDPANEGLDISAQDFQLPSTVNLSAFSLEPILEDVELKPGDRLICKVENWDEGIISVEPSIERTENFQIAPINFIHQQWNKTLEEALKKSFDKMGPCSSIEEQLANVFFENKEVLCTPECSSTHEMLQISKEIGFEFYGVETRLWKSGEDVPAVGEWNKGMLNDFTNEERKNLYFGIPQYIIDNFLRDFMFDKKKTNIAELCDCLLPQGMAVSDAEIKSLSLNIKSRRDILKKQYNWFADFSVSGIRKRMLALYQKVSSMVYRIDGVKGDLTNFPQQELVILSQLFTHLLQMLEALDADPQGAAAEEEAIYLSLEGMEFNYDEIFHALDEATQFSQSTGFKLI